jgi:spermidine/putrescine transport system permease protein
MKTLKRVYAGLIFVFLYSPIVILIVFSFNDSKSRAVWNGFTFRWYAELFRDRQILTAFFYTIAVAVLSSFLATLIGTLAAIGIDSSRRRLKSLYTNITYLPILNPEIVTGISLMLLFIFFKMRLGFLSLLLAHTAVNTSYVIFSVLPRLRLLDKHLYEAALDLGARPIFAYRKVIFPELSRA